MHAELMYIRLKLTSPYLFINAYNTINANCYHTQANMGIFCTFGTGKPVLSYKSWTLE
jgi:hypothetical protein